MPLQFVNELRSQSGLAHPCARKVDKLTLIKHSLMELYENIVDREEIDSFEKAEAVASLPLQFVNELRSQAGRAHPCAREAVTSTLQTQAPRNLRTLPSLPG